MRTIVDIPHEQLDKLARICSRERISRAEAVRRAVSRFIHESTRGEATEAFGIWRSRRIDARRYEDHLRDEWEGRARRPRHQPSR